jgi:hypothetical protein
MIIPLLRVLRFFGLIREVTCASCGSWVEQLKAKRSPLGWLCGRCNAERIARKLLDGAR